MTTDNAAPPDTTPTWRAADAAWWAMAVIVTALAVAGFTALRTLAVASDDEFAPVILAEVLEEPTRDAIAAAGADLDPDQQVVRVRDDLVAFTLPADVVRNEPAQARRQAVDQRVDTLRTEGIPVDPGTDRTATGLPRVLIESLSQDNHGVVADKVPFAAAMVVALLAWTVLLGRRDNLLLLPAAALAGGYLLTVALTEAARIVLDDAGPNTATVFRLLEAAGSEPRHQLGIATVFGLGSAAAYRLAVLALGWWDRRAVDAPVIDAPSDTDPEPRPATQPALARMELVEDVPAVSPNGATAVPEDRRIRVYVRR